jgi:hypothetical protein
MKHSFDIINICPLLLPCSPDFLSYRGFITIQNRDYRLELITSSGSDLKDAQLSIDPELQSHLTSDDWSLISQYLTQTRDIPSFLKELKHLLVRLVTKSDLSQ